MAKVIRCLALMWILYMSACSVAKGQQPKAKAAPFQMVKVPDSIRLKMAYIELGKEELESEFDSAYTAIYVFNLINRNDYVFKNGIYVWNVMGPHFPRRLLILKEGKTCIFKSAGAFETAGVLKEYLECIEDLRLSDSDVRTYLKAISKYLDEEQGKTYGAEVIKE